MGIDLRGKTGAEMKRLSWRRKKRRGRGREVT